MCSPSAILMLFLYFIKWKKFNVIFLYISSDITNPGEKKKESGKHNYLLIAKCDTTLALK